jgi:ABC-type nitrate/sulfonate/bicarbonate transport system substrate-binding protein
VRRLLALALVALAAGGCGGSSGEGPPDGETVLLLDFTPNAVHSGIYLAMSLEYDLAEGVELRIR